MTFVRVFSAVFSWCFRFANMSSAYDLLLDLTERQSKPGSDITYSLKNSMKVCIECAVFECWQVQTGMITCHRDETWLNL